MKVTVRECPGQHLQFFVNVFVWYVWRCLIICVLCESIILCLVFAGLIYWKFFSEPEPPSENHCFLTALSWPWWSGALFDVNRKQIFFSTTANITIIFFTVWCHGMISNFATGSLSSLFCKSLPFFYFLTFKKGRLLYIHPVGWLVGRSVSRRHH